MKRPWIFVGLFLITLGTIAAIAFWAPDREWDRDGRGVEVVQVVDAEGNAIDALSERDVTLARQISAAARELNLPTDPTAVQTV